jgi:hypothetical protein
MHSKIKQDQEYLINGDKYISLLNDILNNASDGDGIHLSEREKLALSFGVEIEDD